MDNLYFPLPRRPLIPIWAIVGLCVLAGVLFSIMPYIMGFTWARPFHFGALLTWQLVYWFIWGGFTFFIGALVRWTTVRNWNSWRRIAAHLLLGTLLAISHSLLLFCVYLFMKRIGFNPFAWTVYFSNVLYRYFNVNLLIYLMVLGAFYYLVRSRKAREREFQTSRLAGQLAQAQLKTLRMQIHPHFLFNTFNTILALMRRDPELAEMVLTRLAEFLRLTLAAADTPHFLLEREMECVRHYLEIQRIRSGSRLQAEWHIQPDALTLHVPPLLLLPLVENAVEHGLSTVCGRSGVVTVFAHIVAERLHLRVEDNGAGVKEPVTEKAGLGNTRERLHSLFGDQFCFRLFNRDGGGAVAELEIPLLAGAEES